MKIVVCDDSNYDAEHVIAHIRRYAKENSAHIDVQRYNSGEALLESLKEYVPPIVFLDVYMGGMTGVETARVMRREHYNCQIILTTSSREHAVDGFEIQAAHYLVKPVEYERLREALDRCGYLIERELESITVMSNREQVSVAIQEILYIEVYNKYSVIVTENARLRTYMTLGELAKLIGKDYFLHCHRSYLINLYKVTGVKENYFIMRDGFEAPIRRPGRAQIKKQYTDFAFGLIKGGLDV